MSIVFETFIGDVAALVVLLLATAWYFVRHLNGYWGRKGLNYIPPVFPFGNFKNTILQRKSFGDHTREIYNTIDEPVVGIWQLLKPTLMIRDPELVQQILIKDFNTFIDRGVYCDEKRDPLSAHLFTLPGERWRNLRAKLSPTFTTGKLKAMFTTLVDCGTPLDAFVDKVAGTGQSIEVRELLSQFTTNVIASVAFGIEIDCIADPNTTFRQIGRKIFTPTIKTGLRSVFSFLFPSVMRFTGIRSVDADVEEFMLSMVRQNMEYREANNVSRKDFFQLMLQIRNTGSIQEDDSFSTTVTSSTKSMSIEECAANALLFFAAGFETSSSTMSFVLYELAKNPEYMRRVQQEIDEVLAKYDGQLTYDSVKEIKYLDWCIDETLRMYPPLPIINRESSTEWTIPNTNITIDKGTAILIPAIALQHDPKYWPQPEQFIPERFCPEKSTNTSFKDRPYMPFGEGPRNCVGLRLGKLQSKFGLIVMLRKYDYELAGSSRLPLELSAETIVVTPIGGINLKVTHRNLK